MFRTRTIPFVLCLAGVFPAVPRLASAADFYSEKTLTIVVGFSTGGGYDLYARAVSNHLADHIPGHPMVVVQNMPGAGSLTAARALNATLPKDGTVIVSFDPSLIAQSLAQPDKVKLDLRKFAWIGVVTPDFRVCYGYGSNGVKSWDELMRRPKFFFGANGVGTSGYINQVTLRDVLQAPVKIILGFPGSAELRLGVEKGELDGDCGGLSSIPADWTRDNKAFPFVRFTKRKPAGMPDAAVFVDDLARTQEDRELLDLVDAPGEIGRAMAMSSSVPADRIAIIRQALNATMRDTAFLAEMQDQHLPVDPSTGEDVQRSIDEILNVSPAVLARAKKVYE